jgi:hypothetical protein
MIMRKYRLLLPILLGLIALPASMPVALAAFQDAHVTAPKPGMARVWFLRPAGANSYALGAAPMIYANAIPVADIPANAAFYRDFAPGAYRFTVQPYGSPNKKADTVQLAPGTQTYLEVQWLPTWEEGYSTGGRHSFFVVNMSPQIAQDWLPALTLIGQR